ncbi:MAG: hypothetical protein MZV64_04605 [Ignavibacteriales bacterium]|nr:hypothetical protein [Ignavibacteriales bacterium]
MALCHNGNLVNARELRDGAEPRRAPSSRPSSDTEVILHLYARVQAPTRLEDALVEALGAGPGRLLAALR